MKAHAIAVVLVALALADLVYRLVGSVSAGLAVLR